MSFYFLPINKVFIFLYEIHVIYTFIKYTSEYLEELCKNNMCFIRENDEFCWLVWETFRGYPVCVVDLIYNQQICQNNIFDLFGTLITNFTNISLNNSETRNKPSYVSRPEPSQDPLLSQDNNAHNWAQTKLQLQVFSNLTDVFKLATDTSNQPLADTCRTYLNRVKLLHLVCSECSYFRCNWHYSLKFDYDAVTQNLSLNVRP